MVMMGSGGVAGLRVGRDGAELRAGAIGADALAGLFACLNGVDAGRAGVRLFGVAGLRDVLCARGAVGAVAAGVLGEGARPVRAVFFDKSAGANWALGWHQDRVIAVRARVDAPGFGGWTVKGGVLHVSPPWEVLAGMVTLRVHLDDVPEGNAPLLISPGSHALGRIAEADVASVVVQCGVAVCLARAGDVWVYATPILHASGVSCGVGRRRVLEVDYAVGALPGGLEWVGV